MTTATTKKSRKSKKSSDGSNNSRRLAAKGGNVSGHTGKPVATKKASEFEVKDAEPKPKKTRKKAVAKKTNAKDKAPVNKNVPTKKEAEVLRHLSNGPKTRKQLAELTGAEKGWSALLGAPSRGVADDTMEGKGWITQEKTESNVLTVSVTAAGKKVLAAFKKAQETVAKEAAKKEAEEKK